MTMDTYFRGQALKPASIAEMRAAIVCGRFIAREPGMSIYSYQGQYFLIVDEALGARPASEQPG